MTKELKCLRCGREMLFIKREKLQLGQTGFFFGDWPNLLAGALEVEIYGCHSCGKLEFYMPGFSEDVDTDIEEEEILMPDADQCIVGVSMDGVPQVLCTNCGKQHDFDDPRCPYCCR